MKSLKYLFLLCVVLLGVTSCKEKTREQAIQDFQSGLSAADSTAMLALCDGCMELLKAKDIDRALDMLSLYDEELHTVAHLPDHFRQSYRRMFTIFPVYNYRRQYYSFQLEGCNDVKYEVVFVEQENSDYNTPYKTSFMFNPVKVDGEWYLCMKTADQNIDESHR